VCVCVCVGSCGRSLGSREANTKIVTKDRRTAMLVSLRSGALGNRLRLSTRSSWRAFAPPIVRGLSVHAKGGSGLGDPPENSPSLENAFPVSLFRNKNAQDRFFDYCRENGVDYSHNSSYLLHRLANADVSTIGPVNLGLTAINVSGNERLLGEQPLGFPLLPYTLFKRDFYGDFLSEVFKSRNVLILGTAGVSKSTWQFVYLHHLLTGMMLKLLP
jgi:hypothetical protein